jgi:hypothetical protein
LKTQCASRTILSDELIFIVYKGLAARGFFLKVIILKTQEALSGYLVESNYPETPMYKVVSNKFEALLSVFAKPLQRRGFTGRNLIIYG